MNHPQIVMAEATGHAHMPLVLEALARAPRDSVGFVCSLADALASDLIAEYAPAEKCFGSHIVDGVHVFALNRVDAAMFVAAPQHSGDHGVLAAIAPRLKGRRCVCFAGGAIVLLESWIGANPS